MHVTDAFEAQQQTAELIFPGEDAFDGPEALLEDRRIKALLATAFRCFAPTLVLGDARGHAAIEDRLAVVPAIVDAIQTEGCTLQVRANGAGHSGEFGQRVAQQRRFVGIARGRHERRDDVAVAIAEGDDLAALEMLVSAIPEVVAAFFSPQSSCCRRG